MKVEKSLETKAPKKEEKMGSLVGNNVEFDKIQDMMFILKSVKAAKGESLDKKDLAMFEKALHTKAATTVSDVADVIPSGFSGTFIQDAIAATTISGVFPFEMINNYGLSDVIGDFAMTAEWVNELGTPTDSNDVLDTFEYRGGKLMAKTFISYEAVRDANIDMLSQKRAGLVRALAVAIEKTLLNGKAGDAGDAGTGFRGLRKLGLTKKAVDFGGNLTEANYRAGLLEMVEEGGLYASWESIQAGDVVVFCPTRVYNSIINFDTFVDASKAGVASTLASGKKVSSVFGIPHIVNRFFPNAVNVAGIVSATPADNVAQSIIMVNTSTFKTYAIANSAIAESERRIENQSILMTQSIDLSAASIFDQTVENPVAINTAKKNIIAGVNIIC